MQLRPSKPTKPIHDVQTKSQEWKPAPEVIIKHDDLYTSACESDFETPIFDKDQNGSNPPNPREMTVYLEHMNAETCSTPATERESSPTILPQTNGLNEGTDTDRYKEPDDKMISEPANLTPANPRSTKYDLRYILKPNCNDDYRY